MLIRDNSQVSKKIFLNEAKLVNRTDAQMDRLGARCGIRIELAGEHCNEK